MTVAEKHRASGRRPDLRNLRSAPLRFQAKDARDVVRLLFLGGCTWIVPERHWPGLCRTCARWEMRRQKQRVDRACERIRAACEAQAIPLEAHDLELERIAGRYYEQVLILAGYRPFGWKPRIELHGMERLHEVLADGRGAILWVSDFTGSGLIAKMALHDAGIRVFHLGRPTHGFSRTAFGVRYLNPLRVRVEDRYLEERVMIWEDDPSEALRRLRQCLRENGVVSISVGAWAKQTLTVSLLSGRITYATGPANIASRSGAPLLPVFSVQDESGTFHVHLGAPLEIPATRKPEAFERTLRQYAAQLEPFIRRYPGQWRTWARVQPA